MLVTTLCGTRAGRLLGWSCGPICDCSDFCPAVWHLRCCTVANGRVLTAAAVVALTAAWIARAVRLDWLRVSTDLAGAATTLPSWCAIPKYPKRFDLSQADFSQRICLGNVRARVSTDAAGLPASVYARAGCGACCY